MRTHTIKCWPAQFAALVRGDKNFEFRTDDRDYDLGDNLRIEEFDPVTQTYSGRHQIRTVTYTLRKSFGVPDGYVVMGLGEEEEEDEDEEATCVSCGDRLIEGDPVYWTEDGLVHALCCGPKRECFHNEDEAELAEGEPIPRPLIWQRDAKDAMQIADDETNDRVCVDRFAQVMNDKLARARAKGRDGWDNPALCTMETLSRMLHEHVAKADPVDVAIFAMMIHTRGGSILPASATFLPDCDNPAAAVDASPTDPKGGE